MALANRKSEDIFNKKTGGTKDAKSITDSKELEIKAKFDNGDHILDEGMFENLAPALYAVQQVAEDIEEIRRFIVSEITSITTSQANAITANTAKVSQGLATANHTMQFDVINAKGTYTLRITIVDSTNPKTPVTKTVDIRLS